VTDRDEQLLRELARRNWQILALLTVGSLFFCELAVAGGVVAGGVVAIVAHHWRERALRSMLAAGDPGAAKRYQLGYMFRLAFLGSAIYLLIARVQVAPLALVVGLSVVVLNIFWTTFKRSI